MYLMSADINVPHIIRSIEPIVTFVPNANPLQITCALFRQIKNPHLCMCQMPTIKCYTCDICQQIKKPHPYTCAKCQ